MRHPWEDTDLPEPHDPMYGCPGPGWHTEAFYFAYDMRWMKGEPATKFPEDDFYCGQCVWDAKRDFQKGIRSRVVLGPTLDEELERRRRVGQLN